MKPEFRSTNVENIIDVRHQILRRDRPIETCYFHGDEEKTTLHFGVFIHQEAVACVSLMKKDNPALKDKAAYQLRGMAVLHQYQGKNIGDLLIKSSENHLKKHEIKMIWCNVRTSAIGFYEKNHYLQIGNNFEIPDVGPHVLMYKYL